MGWPLLAIPLVLVQPEEDASGPVTEPPPASPPMGESEARTTGTATTDPFAVTPLPGFPPGVDINDETTWSDLKPEQKDELRAIRAKMRAKASPPPMGVEREAERFPSDEDRPPLHARRTSSAKEEYWYQREHSLVVSTAAFGVTWGVSTIALALILNANLNGADECNRDASAGIGADSCDRAVERTTNLVVPTYLFGAVSGASFIGTVVSGAMLGAHRNTKPLIFSDGRGLNMGVSGRF